MRKPILSGMLMVLMSPMALAGKSGDCDAKTKASSARLMQLYKDENQQEKKKCQKHPEDLSIAGTKLDPCTMERVNIEVCSSGGDNRFPASQGLTPGEHYTPEPGE